MVNLIPENDEREHIFDVYCWCEPAVTYRHPDTGIELPNGPKITHNAADCREIVEDSLGELLAANKRWILYECD